MSTLVVYFSRTGTTKRVAESIAKALGADIEAIHEPADRRGIRGYARSALDASMSRWVPIAPLGHDPTRYDLVVVGSPVWVASLSAPVRAFLARYAHRLPKLAFFVTMGGSGDRRVLRQMSQVAGAEPAAALTLTQRDVEQGKAAVAIDAFVASLAKTPAPIARLS